jgi:hypothetical protein
MAKNLGTFTFAANFQVKAAEALDPRMVATSKADLINKANWPSDDDTIYVYKGLIVDCGEDGVYRLIDPAKALATDYSGWERIDAGGVKIDNIFTYKGEVESYSALPVVCEVGDVYNVASDFSIGEGEAKKDYPAGTNVAWNGETWDPLAGSIDLSAYATKTEVSTIRTDVGTNATNISNLSTALGLTNEEVAKKVDAVEGYSLISDEKLALIDTNASDIQALEDKNLDSRVSALEGMFKDGETNIDLSQITTSISDHTTRIGQLESGKVDKSDFNSLSQTVTNQAGQITDILAINAQQTTDISGLTTTTTNNTTAISGLTTTVGEHTTAIGTLQTNLNNVTTDVNTIKGDYLKASDISGKLDASEYNTKVAELEAADGANASAIGVVASDLAAEVSRAKAAEEANAEAIKAEKERLDLFLNEATLEGDVIDTLLEIQEYITQHGTDAANMLTAI